jgi:hypothetical protein
VLTGAAFLVAVVTLFLLTTGPGNPSAEGVPGTPTPAPGPSPTLDAVLRATVVVLRATAEARDARGDEVSAYVLASLDSPCRDYLAIGWNELVRPQLFRERLWLVRWDVGTGEALTWLVPESRTGELRAPIPSEFTASWLAGPCTMIASISDEERTRIKASVSRLAAAREATRPRALSDQDLIAIERMRLQADPYDWVDAWAAEDEDEFVRRLLLEPYPVPDARR